MSGRPPAMAPAAGRALLLLFLLALVVRLVVSWLIWTPNLDSAVVGCMALNILDGERPLFFYGQDYMGALEAYLAALLLALFGVSDLTLSLSPILFSLVWMGGTYALFREWFDERTARLVALAMAVPGWNILWYSIGSYGGYPAALSFGAWSLWLAWRIATRPLTPRAQWFHILLLGGLAGLGMWTNYICGAYLLTAVVVLLVYFVRIRFQPAVLVRFAVGSLAFAAGAWPSIRLIAQHRSAGNIAHWVWDADYIRESLRMLWRSNAPGLIFWPIPHAPVIRWLVGGLVATAALLYLARWLAGRGWLDRSRGAVPVLFCLLFLALYVPHRLALHGALRYLLPLVGMFIPAVFSVFVGIRWRWLRRLGWGVWAAWYLYQAAGLTLTVIDRIPSHDHRCAARQRVVQYARDAGLRHVHLIGGTVFGYQGQILTFGAEGAIKFVSVFDERHAPSAQSAESDDRAGLACERRSAVAVAAALRELNVGFENSDDDWLTVFYALTMTPTPRRALAPDSIRIVADEGVAGEPGALLDRTRETDLSGSFDSATGFTLELTDTTEVDSIRLIAPDWFQEGLPEGYRVSVSLDGVEFREVRNVPRRVALGYTAGPRAYLSGYFGALDIRFEPAVPARFVRFSFHRGQKRLKRWNLTEVYAFARVAGPPPDPERDVEALAAEFKARNLEFLTADRWLSGRLWEILGVDPRRPPVYPRFNPNDRTSVLTRRFAPRARTGLAVATALADESARLLTEVYGEALSYERRDFSEYSLFVFEAEALPRPDAPALIWNGQSLWLTRKQPGRVY